MTLKLGVTSTVRSADLLEIYLQTIWDIWMPWGTNTSLTTYQKTSLMDIFVRNDWKAPFLDCYKQTFLVLSLPAEGKQWCGWYYRNICFCIVWMECLKWLALQHWGKEENITAALNNPDHQGSAQINPEYQHQTAMAHLEANSCLQNTQKIHSNNYLEWSPIFTGFLTLIWSTHSLKNGSWIGSEHQSGDSSALFLGLINPLLTLIGPLT